MKIRHLNKLIKRSEAVSAVPGGAYSISFKKFSLVVAYSENKDALKVLFNGNPVAESWNKSIVKSSLSLLKRKNEEQAKESARLIKKEFEDLAEEILTGAEEEDAGVLDLNELFA